MTHLCIHLSDTQGVFSSRELREKWGFPFHLVWCFAFFQRRLCPRGAYAPKNGLTHFTSKCFAQTLVLRPNSKNGVSHFIPLVFCISRAVSVRAVPMRKKMECITSCHHFILQSRALSISQGGLLPIALARLVLPFWQSSMGVHEIMHHE